jgi:hypothetical protein
MGLPTPSDRYYLGITAGQFNRFTAEMCQLLALMQIPESTEKWLEDVSLPIAAR